MKKVIELTREIAAPLELAYHVAAEVERYPEFVPVVEDVKIISEEDTRKVAVLRLRIGSFVTTLKAQAIYKENQSIEIEQLEGPARKLHQRWQFQETENGIRVTFTTYLEIHGRLFGLLISKIIIKLANDIMQAFLNRIHQLSKEEA